MNFNGFVFPCPKFDFRRFKTFKDQIIYIPKNKNNIYFNEFQWIRISLSKI